MMDEDPTETTRRKLVHEINSNPGDRKTLEETYAQVWDPKQLQQDFTVHSFAAPFVVATKRSNDVKGSLMFQHDPRFYFGWRGLDE